MEFTPLGIRGELSTPRGNLSFESPLLGTYNLSNILAAAAGAEALGDGEADRYRKMIERELDDLGA